MPWLADLVQSSEGSLDVLPVQCLCEFLLHDAADDSSPAEDEDEGESKEQRAKKRQVRRPPSETVSPADPNTESRNGTVYFFFSPLPQRQQKQRQLLGRLQDLLLGPKADEQTTCEVLDYFLRRLSSSQVASRVLAMKVRHVGRTRPQCESYINGLHLYSAFIQSAVQFMPLIHPFTHTFTHQRRLAAMQGTDQLVGSNRGLGVSLRDISTRPGWDRTGNPPTAR